MNDRKVIAALLKFFPASWRFEYGPELSSLLEQGSLTQAIIWDIIRSGISERLRRFRITTTGGAIVACWYFLGLIVNTVHAMPPKAYNAFWESYLLLAVGLGFCFRRAGVARPGMSTSYAILLGSLPMLVTELLRKLDWLDPTILDLRGQVWRQGHGFTEFAVRGVSNSADLYSFVVVLFISSAFASIAGWLGAQIADAVRAFNTARIRR